VLLERYSKVNIEFQNLKVSEFIDINTLDAMLNNFQRDNDGNLKIANNNVTPGVCDVWPLFIKLDDKNFKDYLYNLAKDILKELVNNNIKIYWTPRETYHISMVLFQDLRPCDMEDKKLLDTRLSIDQIKKITEQIKPIINNTFSFKLKLYGLNMGRGGSLTALFIDSGQYLKLQQEISDKLNSISYMPERKYKKDIVHITLARILEPLNEELFLNIKENIKNYYNLLDLNLYIDVNKVFLAHEIQWMHEKLETNSEIEFKLKLGIN
jgi:hypothetical protein